MTTFRHALISERLNVNRPQELLEGAAIVPMCRVPWRVVKRRLHGGRQEGVDLVEIDNGKLTIRLVPTRGLSIFDVRMGDVRLGWDSPARQIVHPAFVQPHNRNGLGWLEGFSEWLVRCGLEWFGPPGSDTQHRARGEAPAANLTLHGRIANMPASELHLEADLKPPYRLRLVGSVWESQLFGPKFELRSTLTVEPGASGFMIDDRIVNHGSQAEEFQLLYHINTGRPILEPGARLVAPAARIGPTNARATEEDGVKRYAEYGPPEPGFAEQCYMLRLHAGKDGRSAVMLHNKAADRAVSLQFPVKALPCLTIWKCRQDDRDGYVTGLEPGTGFPFPRAVERKRGRVPVIEAGGAFAASIEVGMHAGKAEVARTGRAIRAIAAGRRTIVDQHPPTD
jgi:hypothetical protein